MRDSSFQQYSVDRTLCRRWEDSAIHQAHVKGLTTRHRGVPEALRGTFEGLAHPATIAHLHRIGVTEVELLPIHAFVEDRHLLEKGRSTSAGNPYMSSGRRNRARRSQSRPLQPIRALDCNALCPAPRR